MSSLPSLLPTTHAVVSVQFIPAAYEVTEGEQVAFMAVLSAPLSTDVTVDFATSDGSATGTLHSYTLSKLAGF